MRICPDGTLRINGGSDITLLGSTGCIQIGETLNLATGAGEHIAIDKNEIQAKLDQTNVATLIINSKGGVVKFGGQNGTSAIYLNDGAISGVETLDVDTISGVEKIIGNDSNYNLYASRIVKWQSGLFLLGTSRQDGISSISDPIPVSADKFGIHTST